MVTELKGVGPATLVRLSKLGINTISDLLFLLPSRYENRTKITPIRYLKIGSFAVIEGKITNNEIVHNHLLSHITDDTSHITMRLIHFNAGQRSQLAKPGIKIRCFGEPRWSKYGLEMIHPEYRILAKNKVTPLDPSLTPIYPTTAGLSQTTLRKLTNEALKFPLQEFLPSEILASLNFPTIDKALHYVHRPPIDANLDELLQFRHVMQQRLIFSELLAQQLSILRLRAKIRTRLAPQLKNHNKLFTLLLKNLPFKLTAAQDRVINEINSDLQQPKPMLRLLQGDVGSGKTIVALAAILQAVENSVQAAIMAPTEILAEQHLQNFSKWLQPFNINISWLSGMITGKARANTLNDIANGKAEVIVGTHALFQKEVKFANLALVVIDEQHRFGVHQRLALCKKGKFPHQLIMTATPIPRTLAMLAYADLDCSIIDELPSGRKPVVTVTIPNNRRLEVLARVRSCCQQGRQAYWVCPLIEESEVVQCQAAENTAQQLKESLPELTVGLIHGRMKAKDKQQVMANFKQGQINLLVATTVVEVGVDIANASLMIIENPERLGLAQLHQLRGRIGRGNQDSHCVLLYQAPLSTNAKQRLQTMRESSDGFFLAQKDLELRGPGELLGTRQTGLLQLKIANIIRDQYLLAKVQQVAKQLLANHSEAIESIIKRWVGKRVIYANV